MRDKCNYEAGSPLYVVYIYMCTYVVHIMYVFAITLVIGTFDGGEFVANRLPESWGTRCQLV